MDEQFHENVMITFIMICQPEIVITILVFSSNQYYFQVNLGRRQKRWNVVFEHNSLFETKIARNTTFLSFVHEEYDGCVHFPRLNTKSTSQNSSLPKHILFSGRSSLYWEKMGEGS